MKNLLLLDADIVINLYELGYWRPVLSQNKVHLSSTIIDEIRYYRKNDEAIPIDLKPLLKSGEVVEVTVSVLDQKEVYDLLVANNADGVHAGELEALSFIFHKNGESFEIALKDHAAIKAAVVLGISDQAISVETLLRKSGVIRKKLSLPFSLTERRFQGLKTEGAFLSIMDKSRRQKKR